VFEQILQSFAISSGFRSPRTGTLVVMLHSVERADLRREQARLRRELDSLKRTAEGWKTELYSNISLAKELGLLSPDTPLGISEEKAIGLLWATIAQADRRGTTSDFQPAPPSLESPAREIVSLRQEEQELALSLSI
jgi:hypothetical protein